MTQTADTTHWNDLSEGYDPVIDTDPSNRALLAAAIDELPSGAGTLLDLGCGTGRLTQKCRAVLPDTHITCADPAPNMVVAAREKFADDPAMDFAEATAADLSAFADGSFDVVITSFALHHMPVPEIPVAAAELFRVLRPGGKFINADQFCRVMGEAGSRERVTDLFDLLTSKAKYYLENASIERMLLQMDLLPLFLREDGEIMTTPEIWTDALSAAGFADVAAIPTPPVELYNRVLVATKR